MLSPRSLSFVTEREPSLASVSGIGMTSFRMTSVSVMSVFFGSLLMVSFLLVDVGDYL